MGSRKPDLFSKVHRYIIQVLLVFLLLVGVAKLVISELNSFRSPSGVERMQGN